MVLFKINEVAVYFTEKRFKYLCSTNTFLWSNEWTCISNKLWNTAEACHPELWGVAYPPVVPVPAHEAIM